jgi:hypothetical protein
MFVAGDVITTLDELLQQEWVMWFGRARHIEIIKSLQLRCVLQLIKAGYFKKAVRKEFFK